jgi:hypothetical protein
MNRYKQLLAVFAFSLMFLALPSIASAQWRDNDNNRNNRDKRDNRNNRDDRDNRDNRGNQNTRNLNGTIKSLKNLSNQFERQVDREFDRDRNRRGNQLKRLAERFKDATNDLDRSYKNQRDYDRSRTQARRVLNIGSQIDREISRARVSRNVQNSWNTINRNLQTLARAYNSGYNNRDNDDYGNSGNNRRNFPFPF